MSISRRTAIAVRTIGVASAAAALALGVAGNAFACSISEFSAQASCDNGKGSIDVTNKDYSHTLVNITVSQGQTEVGHQENLTGTRQGVTVNFPVDWSPSTTYTVTVVKASGQKVGTTDVKTPETACKVDTPTTPATDTPTTPATDTPSDTPTTPATETPSTAPSDTPTATPSTSGAAAVDDTNAPSPAAGGTTDLAETGGGSNTGMIAGVAGALVVVGGGAVYGLRRRTAGARH
ncbi:LAETG motif-containing sortase-dependent surface protein [Streptomyces sp. NPDC088197]|uniref:LAETG motif-containing sortase-dependent surface protein n=1 Tax=unclassified Streptomyces TaxID=2593676 RepID=UPI00339F6631